MNPSAKKPTTSRLTLDDWRRLNKDARAVEAKKIMSKNAGQIDNELHDPRLWSNLRGAMALESAEERVRAHKKLPKGRRESIGEAMRLGWHRKKATMNKHAFHAGLEAAGLGLLAAPVVHSAINTLRNKEEGKGTKLLHSGAELAGLGVLVPHVQEKLMKTFPKILKHAGAAPTYDVDKVPKDIRERVRVTRDVSFEEGVKTAFLGLDLKSRPGLAIGSLLGLIITRSLTPNAHRLDG